MEAGDADAIRNLGCYYRDGKYGLPQDYKKAMKLFLLGGALSYNNIGYFYRRGQAVERDGKKVRRLAIPRNILTKV